MIAESALPVGAVSQDTPEVRILFNILSCPLTPSTYLITFVQSEVTARLLCRIGACVGSHDQKQCFVGATLSRYFSSSKNDYKSPCHTCYVHWTHLETKSTSSAYCYMLFLVLASPPVSERPSMSQKIKSGYDIYVVRVHVSISCNVSYSSTDALKKVTYLQNIGALSSWSASSPA